MRTTWKGLCLWLVLAASLMAAGCGRKTETSTEQTPGKALSGTIRVSGAWALYPMMVKWGEEFGKIHPAVHIDVSAGGAGKGAADALKGMVDIGMVSREVRPEEIQQGGVFVPAVKDAVFPTINEANPALQKGEGTGEDRPQLCIRRSVFAAVFIEGRGMTWGEVFGTALAEKVRPYTRSDSCGAAETWAKYLGGAQEDLKGVGVFGDPGLAEAVRQDVLGMGYNNLNFAYDAATGQPVKGLYVVAIDVNENGKCDPEEDLATKDKAIQAIKSGAYPSPPARDLYLLTKGGFTGVTREFVRWILTDGQAVALEVGYIRLTDTQIEGALQKLEQ